MFKMFYDKAFATFHDVGKMKFRIGRLADRGVNNGSFASRPLCLAIAS